MSNEKCFCHFTDPITGEKYVVKDKAAREELEKFKETFKNELENFDNKISHYKKRVRTYPKSYFPTSTTREILIDSKLKFTNIIINCIVMNDYDGTTNDTYTCIPITIPIYSQTHQNRSQFYRRSSSNTSTLLGYVKFAGTTGTDAVFQKWNVHVQERDYEGNPLSTGWIDSIDVEYLES